jgi:predicted DNA-binding transcriptional regulator YafY
LSYPLVYYHHFHGSRQLPTAQAPFHGHRKGDGRGTSLEGTGTFLLSTPRWAFRTDFACRLLQYKLLVDACWQIEVPLFLSARPALVRLAVIDQAIRQGKWPNASTLGRMLEVSPRTVQRDLIFLRDRLRAPLEFDSRRNGYHYTCIDFQLPLFRMTRGELVALFLAERVLRQCQGTPFEVDLRLALERLSAQLPQDVSVDLGSLADTLSVTPTTVTVHDLDTFAAVAAAVSSRRQLELDYWTAGRNARTRRVVDPYHLTLIDSDWYLIASCHLRRRVLTFLVKRVRAARQTGETFERPVDFHIERFLKGSFRAWQGEGWYQVTLRFGPEVAGLVSEKIWHRSQTTEPCADGGLLVHFEVSDLCEVKRWVLSWGRECCVVGQEELKELVKQELAAMLDQVTRDNRPCALQPERQEQTSPGHRLGTQKRTMG